MGGLFGFLLVLQVCFFFLFIYIIHLLFAYPHLSFIYHSFIIHLLHIYSLLPSLRTPALYSYDLVDRSYTKYHEITVSVDRPQTRTLYVGVYGNPLGLHGEEVEFDVVAWASPF